MTDKIELFEKLADKESGGVSFKAFTHFFSETFSGCSADPEFEKKVLVIFKKFATSDPDLLTESEFIKIWDCFLRRCTRPKTALIIVDYQNDFIDGSLSMRMCPRGENPLTILPGLNKMVDLFDVVVYTYDWHPEGHVSFLECHEKRPRHKTNTATNVVISTEVVLDVGGMPVKQKMWPRHCVKDTHGAQLHKDLKIKPDSLHIHKGTDIDVDSYSAFWDNSRSSKTTLTADLRTRGINNVYVAGLAYDACVSWTALDAICEGFMTTLIRDLTCSISNELTAEADARLKAAHCAQISSSAISKESISKPVSWAVVWQQAKKHC